MRESGGAARISLEGTVRYADLALALHLAGGNCTASGRWSFPSVQVVPVQNRVEREEISSLRLPAPEGAQREHYDVAFADRDIDSQGAVRDRVAAAQCAREQQVIGVSAEL